MFFLLRTSRPRFWLYLLGPALVALAATGDPLTQLRDWHIILQILMWTLPANLFLYGINDLCDVDTDALNEKKSSYEQRLQVDQRRLLTVAVVLAALLTLAAVLLTSHPVAWLAITLFVFFGWSYSAPPCRWKARPFVDSLSNVLYIMPGVAIAAACGVDVLPLAILGGWAWSSSMHLFSAIPDIEADKQVGLHTTAVVLGRTSSLLVCSGLWAMSMAAAFALFGTNPVSILSLAYVALPLTLLRTNHAQLFRAYQRMPLINGVLGCILFLTLII